MNSNVYIIYIYILIINCISTITCIYTKTERRIEMSVFIYIRIYTYINLPVWFHQSLQLIHGPKNRSKSDSLAENEAMAKNPSFVLNPHKNKKRGWL